MILLKSLKKSAEKGASLGRFTSGTGTSLIMFLRVPSWALNVWELNSELLWGIIWVECFNFCHKNIYFIRIFHQNDGLVLSHFFPRFRLMRRNLNYSKAMKLRLVNIAASGCNYVFGCARTRHYRPQNRFKNLQFAIKMLPAAISGE